MSFNLIHASLLHPPIWGLLSSFTSQINYGFSLGQDPNKVNANAPCKGDLALKDCHTYFNDSVSILLQCRIALIRREAIIWAQRCTKMSLHLRRWACTQTSQFSVWMKMSLLSLCRAYFGFFYKENWQIKKLTHDMCQ